MGHLVWLIPVSLGMGLVGLSAFLWSLKTGQFEDLSGAAERVLFDAAEHAPHPDREHRSSDRR